MLFVACDWCTLLCWEPAEYKDWRKPAFFSYYLFFCLFLQQSGRPCLNYYLERRFQRRFEGGHTVIRNVWWFLHFSPFFFEMVGFWYQKDLCPWAIALNESILQSMKQQSARGTTHLKAVTNLVWCHPPSVIIRVAGYPVQGFYWSEYSRPLVSSPLRVRKSRVTHKVWRTKKNTTLQTQSF